MVQNPGTNNEFQAQDLAEDLAWFTRWDPKSRWGDEALEMEEVEKVVTGSEEKEVGNSLEEKEVGNSLEESK